MSSLIRINNLQVEYPSRHGVFIALNQISLNVDAGTIHGLVGESGAGKSTVGSAIVGLLENPGHITAGEIIFDGQRIDEHSEKSLRALRGRSIGMIFQDPLTSLNPLLTVAEQLTETIIYHLKFSRKEAWERCLQLLREVDIPDPEQRAHYYPHQFSGGMRQRVVIALALCSEPKLLIADEPTTALDVSVQAQILQLIKRLTKSHNLGVILVTHDMGVIAQTTDKVTVLYQGQVVETGDTQTILKDPQHGYTQSLLSAVPRADRKLKRFPHASWIEDDVQSNFSDLLDDWKASSVKIVKGESQNILSVNKLNMHFKTAGSLFSGASKIIKAVNDVSFDVKRGEVFGIVGESGSGKSTVARMITRLYEPTSGNIAFEGESVTGTIPKVRLNHYRRCTQMIFQDPYSSMNPRMRVRDIIAEPILLYGLANKKEAFLRVNKLLEHIGLDTAAGLKFPHEFSGGQRQRISIARALATEPRLLICDEPTSALDVSIQAQILNILKDLQEVLGLTMIFISHDLPVIRQMCDRVAVMKQGHLLELTETAELFNSPKHEYTRTLLKLIPSAPVTCDSVDSHITTT